MKKKEYSTIEVLGILRSNGYTLCRQTGSSHQVFTNGKNKISIPTSRKTVNKMLFARLVREYNLVLN